VKDKDIRAILLCIAAFAAVTALMLSGVLRDLDEAIQQNVYNFFDNTLVTNFFLFITDYTLGTVIGAAAVCLLFLYKRHFYGIISLGISFVGMFAATEILKHFINRLRPFIYDQSITYLGVSAPDGFSFPSGHTTISFFLAFVVAHKFKDSKLIVFSAYVFASLVAFSRLYLGAHYPMDLLGGMFLGLIFGHVAVSIDKKLLKQDSLIKNLLQNVRRPQ
jgi:undecaprenyl-diphosphatase